ncbi:MULTISPECIES: sulfite exporter TauE/SafE family protein [Paenibacillus]|uniref:Urease accessory protein UreH n=1 Tax=Paenibacillus selenitireducens TaxID=1324314 RepID=A0A1T2X4B1_9BACL|nr:MULTISPECIES: sulfite exporter TauE/SafE family protein [Paenibacillus]OPA74738.1 urease accessory protein UreH [Paenibacillus selenitireducens]
MGLGLLSVLGVGFLLGIKHAIEPDHVIAVSTIASHSKKLWRTSLAGVFWGIGHTTTLFVVGLILILTKNNISEKVSGSLEFLVGIMLVYLGISSLISVGRSKKAYLHQHQHHHEEHTHYVSQPTASHKGISYIKSMVIGLVHGIAGSGAMVLLTMSTVQSVWDGALYILIFGLGTIAGMLLFTTILGIPFVLSASNRHVNLTLTQVTGVVSTLFGFYYIYSLGITQGLFG